MALQVAAFFGDELGFFVVVIGAEIADFVAAFGFGVQVFAQPFAVVLDNGVSGGKNVAHGAIVTFQLDGGGDIEFAHQVGHVAHVCAAKAIDGLVVVAHGKNRALLACNEFEPCVLQLVGVLKFVHQNVVEAVLVVRAQHFVDIEHFVAAQHQLGKIRHAFLLALFFVFGVAQDEPLQMRVWRVQAACAQARFFLRVDKALQHARGKAFFGDVKLFEQAFNQRELVAAV